MSSSAVDAGAANVGAAKPAPRSCWQRFLKGRELHVSGVRDTKSLTEDLASFLRSHGVTSVVMNDSGLAPLTFILRQLAGCEGCVEKLSIDCWGVAWTPTLQVAFKEACDSNPHLTTLTVRLRLKGLEMVEMLMCVPEKVEVLDIGDNMMDKSVIPLLVGMIGRCHLQTLLMDKCGVGNNIDWLNTFYQQLIELPHIALECLEGLDLSLVADLPIPVRKALKNPSRDKVRLPGAGRTDRSRAMSMWPNGPFIDYIRNRAFSDIVKGQSARVWWPPTEDEAKTDFSGRYWPAKVLRCNPVDLVFTVQYDNSEVENVTARDIQPPSPYHYGCHTPPASRIPFPYASAEPTPTPTPGPRRPSPAPAPSTPRDGQSCSAVCGAKAEAIPMTDGEKSAAADDVEMTPADAGPANKRKGNEELPPPKAAKKLAREGSDCPGADAEKSPSAAAPGPSETDTATQDRDTPTAGKGSRRIKRKAQGKSKKGKRDSQAADGTPVSASVSPSAAAAAGGCGGGGSPAAGAVARGDIYVTDREIYGDGGAVDAVAVPAELEGCVLAIGEFCEFRDPEESSDPSDYFGYVVGIQRHEPMYTVRYVYYDDHDVVPVSSKDIRRAAIIPYVQWRDAHLDIVFAKKRGDHLLDNEASSSPAAAAAAAARQSTNDPAPEMPMFLLRPVARRVCRESSARYVPPSVLDFKHLSAEVFGQWLYRQSLHEHPRLTDTAHRARLHQKSKDELVDEVERLQSQVAILSQKNHKRVATDTEVSKLRRQVEEYHSQIQTLQSDLRCMICCERRFHCVLKPCLHFQFCSQCAQQTKKCPLCRGTITGVITLKLPDEDACDKSPDAAAAGEGRGHHHDD
ncbi:unnamed protein product [Vitrella brassicaformis CCMP3155]|uniref:RING-type domain-containing protein n=2 Tax=Vitrella brassicaformis TaxID=1169539 RepID=A0A0G4EKI6_VITBC|nr:unnamed protein product [Vitrella brassicaformis CCMP3155]|eukprot:CEL97043.1 unnamed protein product [Vitrella brassicaformis CCMP3155]